MRDIGKSERPLRAATLKGQAIINITQSYYKAEREEKQVIDISKIENPEEEFIRDSEKIRIIQSFIENTEYGPGRDELCCILGIQIPDQGKKNG